MTATRMCHEMSLREFMLWRIRYSHSPFGQHRDDMRYMRLSALIANANRNSDIKPDPFVWEDFKLYVDDVYDGKEITDDEDAVEEDEGATVQSGALNWFYTVAKKPDDYEERE